MCDVKKFKPSIFGMRESEYGKYVTNQNYVNVERKMLSSQRHLATVEYQNKLVHVKNEQMQDKLDGMLDFLTDDLTVLQKIALIKKLCKVPDCSKEVSIVLLYNKIDIQTDIQVK